MEITNHGNHEFSKTVLFIGGIKVFLYNADVLVPYVQKNNREDEKQGEEGNSLSKQSPINVVYLMHQRLRDYKFTETVAYDILRQYYAKTESHVPLICVTMDNRNHGERAVDVSKNRSWSGGNATHALDMISIVRGMVYDFKLVTEYLPTYLNLEYHLSTAARERGISISYTNIVSGYSLGGHAAIRFAFSFPELVQVLNPVISCSELTSLLLLRMANVPIDSPDYDKRWFYYDYDDLKLSEQQKEHHYPEAFHKLLSKEDIGVFENFPFRDIKMFAAYGGADSLVPPRLSHIWTEVYQNSNPDTEVFVHQGVGHEVTPEMIDKFTSYLVKHL